MGAPLKRKVGWYTKEDGSQCYWSREEQDMYECFCDGFEAARNAAPYTSVDDAFRAYYPED